MAGHRQLSGAATVLCFLAAGLVSGCDGDDASNEPAAAPPSPTGEHGVPSDVDAPSPPSGDARCVRAERREARSPWTWRAVDEVAQSVSGHSSRARASVERFFADSRALLRKRCDGAPSAAFDNFSHEIRGLLVDDSFGNRELDQVLAAWLRWGKAVGEPREARRTIHEVRSCRVLFTRFDATYRTWWRWTSTGKAWWIDVTFENRTGELQWGSTWGWMKVTEMLPASFGPQGEPAPVEDAVLQTGASSLDSFNAPPGRTVWRVPVGADNGEVQTTAAGTLEVTDMAYYLLARGETYDCNAPVLPEL